MPVPWFPLGRQRALLSVIAFCFKAELCGKGLPCTDSHERDVLPVC